MKTRAKLLNLTFVVLSFAVAGYFYPGLPDPIPSHWNAQGVIDGYTPKPWGPFIMPLVMVGVFLLLLAVPRMSPQGFRVERFGRVYEIICAVLMGFMFFVSVAVLLAAKGSRLPMDKVIQVAMGVLFAVLGNFMSKFTRNFFVGIRTPWTLASDEVWLRTHRLGGQVFVLAGVVLIISGLVGGGVIPLLVAIAATAIIPVGYSWVLYRRLEGFRDTPSDDKP